MSEKDSVEFYTKTDLKSRNWTEKLIKDFLGNPDVTKKRFGGGFCSLFHKEKVERLENTEAFKAYQEKIKKRREKSSLRMKLIMTAKREELLNYINSIEIEIENYSSKQELFKAACDSYNSLPQRFYDGNVASPKGDISFLKRISTNMLRHDSSHYEYELNRLFGKVGREEGYVLLKQRIDDLILKKYPFLK